jgi:hypothetical protein
VTVGAARRIAIALLAGAGVGLVILGIGGRIAMRIIALAAGQAPGFSVGGTFDVVLLGGLWGAPGGPIVLLLERLVTRRRTLHGVVLGVIGFAAALLTVGRQLEGSVTQPPVWPIAVGLCGVLFLAYGVAVAVVLGWWSERGS